MGYKEDEKAQEAYWKWQDTQYRRDKLSGGLGYLTPQGFVPGKKKDALLYVDHNSALGRAIIEDRKNKELQMAYEYKEGQGSLFVNNKDGVESRPDRTGRMMLGGKMYRISGWIKESTNGGKPWLSLSIQEEKPKEEAAPAPAPKPEPDQDIPF